MRSVLILSFFGISHAWQPADRAALKGLIDDCVETGVFANGQYTGGTDGSECYACDDGTHKTSSTASCDDGSTPQFISDWDTSLVTDFLGLFLTKIKFNQPIGNWDTSQSTNFQFMFMNAHAFNQPLANWNTAKATTMQKMFVQAYAFNQPIGNWDTSQVTTMNQMFSTVGAGLGLAFNQPIGNWDTSKVTDMALMLFNSAFDQDLSTWNTGSVTNARLMFALTPFNQDISSWDMSKNTRFDGMFKGTDLTPSKFNQDISTWNVANGIYFQEMFKNSPFDQDLKCWDISSGLQFQNMFENSQMSHTLCWDISGISSTYKAGMFTGTTGSVDDTCTAPCTRNGEACTADSDCRSGSCESSVCAIPQCDADEKVVAGACVACPAGKTNAAGDLLDTDTTCDTTFCEKNHHVVNHACQPCPEGVRPAGDDASGEDTECLTGPCNGLTCVRGSCVNNICQCPVGYSGMTCDKDVTAAGLQTFLKSSRRPLATKQQKKETRKQIRSFIKDTLTKALLTKTVKEAIQETKVTVDRSDLPDKANLVVLQLEKQPVIALASQNKDTDDTCGQGLNSASCGMLDIKENPHEVVFLNTQDEPGSWSVLNSGNQILSKQTRVSEEVYDMQCWNQTKWTDKVRFDTSTETELFECNEHLILIGSQAAVCTTDTCKNGGTCMPDGYSFTCKCPPNYSGNICQHIADITHCHQIDCSDFGGHKGGECTDCSYSECCNYATKTLFNNHCDTLTATQDYVNAKCCHRTLCL